MCEQHGEMIGGSVSVMDVDSCVVSGGMAASPFARDDPMTCRGLVQ